MKFFVLNPEHAGHDTFEEAERYASRVAKGSPGITIIIAKAHAEVLVEHHVTLLDDQVEVLSTQDLKELAENATVGPMIEVDTEKEVLEKVGKALDSIDASKSPRVLLEAKLLEAKSSEHHPHVTAEFLKRENGEIK